MTPEDSPRGRATQRSGRTGGDRPMKTEVSPASISWSIFFLGIIDCFVWMVHDGLEESVVRNLRRTELLTR